MYMVADDDVLVPNLQNFKLLGIHSEPCAEKKKSEEILLWNCIY